MSAPLYCMSTIVDWSGYGIPSHIIHHVMALKGMSLYIRAKFKKLTKNLHFTNNMKVNRKT